MPAPTPMQCMSPQCEFVTPTGIPTYELMLRTLELHMQAAHSLSVNNGSNISTQVKAERPRRPSVKIGLNESDWAFFQHEWDRYTRQTKLEGQTLIDELWSCMDQELRQLAFNEGSSFTNVNQLMSTIKCLSVTTLHPSVHVVALHQMKQDEGETTKAFAARVKGSAKNCNLTKKCTCQLDVSYLEETSYHVVMSGLYDGALKDKVLTQAMLGNVTNMTTLLNYTAAEESAKAADKTSEISAIRKSQYKNGEKADQHQLKCYHY